MLQNQIKELQREIAESEAVEKFIMKKVSSGCAYEDLLKAHYREGEVVNGEWVDKDEEDESQEQERKSLLERFSENFYEWEDDYDIKKQFFQQADLEEVREIINNCEKIWEFFGFF